MKQRLDKKEMARQILEAKDEQEVIAILKRYNFYEEGKCKMCVRWLEIRSAHIG